MIKMMRNSDQQAGFTLVEMILVIVITGIIGGMVAMFIRAPVQGYVDSARRANLTDIADTALRRITRDLRLALPNSVRVTTVACGASMCSYLEFLPTGSPSCPANTACLGGGRYRTGTGGGAGCAALPGGEELDFTAADGCFGVLGALPTMSAATGDQIVVYNLGIPCSDAYETTPAAPCASTNRATFLSNPAATTVAIAPKQFPFDSPSHRFHVISTPVTYACIPAAGGIGGTLARYWGYAIQATQPTAPGTLTSANSGALLATNVSACNFTYDTMVSVSTRNGLVTVNLSITESGETVTLYGAAHVNNMP